MDRRPDGRFQPVSPTNAFLDRLRRYGAHRLQAVRFRRNRNTLWSLTAGGTRLNLHEGYRDAPEDVVQALATIARTASARTPEARRAAQVVRAWPGIRQALVRVRHEDRTRGAPIRRARCAGTGAQRAAVRRLYVNFNEARFGGRLPEDVPIRLSNRMTTRLGHMAVATRDPERTVREIALNLQLLNPGRETALEETLLHEMAHAAAWLFDGHAGHGRAWKSWARQAGCEPVRCVAHPRSR